MLRFDGGHLPMALGVFTLLGLGGLVGAIASGGMALGRQLRLPAPEQS